MKVDQKKIVTFIRDQLYLNFSSEFILMSFEKKKQTEKKLFFFSLFCVFRSQFYQKPINQFAYMHSSVDLENDQ